MRARARDERRSDTNRSLGEERSKADKTLAEAHAEIEKTAEDTVQAARDRADAMIATSRRQRDRGRPDAGTDGGAQERIDRERRQEDALVQVERRAADTVTRAERDERSALLRDLLSTERASTDHHLARERVFADEQLASRDNFLGIVSHDVRTLLGGISLNTSGILKIAPGDETGARIRKKAEGIQRYVERMARLVDDLLDVVSMDAGHVSIIPDRRDAAQLLRDAASVFQPIAADKDIRIDVDTGQAPLLARLDELRILQVLLNLLSNAVKYSPRQSVVSVSAERAGSEVMFTVRDQGPGIPQDMLDVVFERFQRVVPAERRGFGLGLFISKSIVEAHGGRIWAESAVGQGSTLKFTLPSAAASEGGNEES